ncbi:RNA recognition motif domain-containing protein [Dioscorea alata]|uniref:RNA recognition motif domain-containing protein n=2 Tax=Dioscorea alata TaxID=55571 RepID=A0ACB7V7B5_DIOAL|nr:RNA recognition motif domain-containing protein [Dioscorea alata]
MFGSGGVSDGYEGTKRARMIESNPYFAVSSGAGSDGFNNGSKRLRTMESNPYFSTRGGISSFQQSYGYRDVVDCLLVNKNGRFSGEAFVVFPSMMQTEFALQKDRQNMGRRYIEVFRGSKMEYYHAIAAEVNSGGATEHEYRRGSPVSRPKKSFEDKDQMEYTEVLKLRGLPYSATKSDIVDFFGEEFGLGEENVQIACRSDGKATGEAFVEFESAEMAKKAMCKDKMMIGSRYVELFLSTPEEARRADFRSRQ